MNSFHIINLFNYIDNKLKEDEHRLNKIGNEIIELYLVLID